MEREGNAPQTGVSQSQCHANICQGDNCVKSLNLIQPSPQTDSPPTTDELASDTCLLYFASQPVQSFGPLEKGFNTGVREDPFCPQQALSTDRTSPADSFSESLHLSFGKFGFERYFNTGIVKILPKSISVFTFLFLEPSRDRDLFLK